jgi:predicted lipid-binding transport protein (Tim44 family)
MRNRGGARRQVLRELRSHAHLSGSVEKGRATAGIVALALAGPAFCRTGGGNHTPSTDSSANSHSSNQSFGSGSLGGLFVLLILALIAGYIFRRIRAGTQSQAALSVLGSVLGAAAGGRGGNVSAPELPPAIETIRAVDPGFELETFLQRAEMAFFLVKRGLRRNDANSVRPYLNDAVFALVSHEIAASKSQRRHALLEGLNVRAVHLDSADSNEQSQTIQVHFDLVYRAKTLDDANQVVADEKQDTRHAERWTFMRKAGARSAVSGGVTASKCPACGAELRLNLDGTCAHCKASVTNGTVDWVVSDIQTAQYVGYSADSALAVAAPSIEEGLATLAGSDKDFSISTFQTRVKTAFMALQDAWCKQNLDTGRAFMSPGAYFTWSAQTETLAAEGRRNVMENIAVQRILPLRIVHGRVFDDLTVRITAAAADYEVDSSNKIVFGDRQVRPFTEDWTFQRSVGVITSNKPGTLENTCPSCGAPIALTQIGECRYCKAAVTSGKFDWVVSRIDQEDGAGNMGGILDGVGEQLALQVGGAIVGGLLSSLVNKRLK